MSTKKRALGSGLAHRFQFLTAILVVLCSTTIGLVSYQSALSGLNQSLHAHGQTLADVTARNAEFALFSLDKESMSALVSAVESDPMVSYATIHKANGEMVISKNSGDGPKTLSPLDPDQLKAEVREDTKTWLEITEPVYTDSSELSIDVASPKPRLLGYVRFGLSFEVMEQHAKRQLIVTLGVMAVMLLLSMLLGVWWSRAITRPLSELAQGTRAVAEGHMVPVQVSAGISELDELASAFNKMLAQLAEKTDLETQYRLQLEEQVVERTRALEGALARAESASVTKSRFLANISHEIRTPLNAVLGLAELLRRGVEVEKAQMFARTIHESALGLLALINDVLDFSKGSADEIHIAHKHVELRGLVHEVVRMVRGASEAKGLDLTWEVEPAVPAIVLSDRLRLRQVLLNLITNAVKFTTEGEISVLIKVLDPTPIDHPLLEISVCDTGAGIDTAHHQRLFTPFAQVNDSMTRQYGGTGLGLAITRQIVDALGGEIHLQSARGEGSTFRVELRFVVDETTSSMVPNQDLEWIPPANHTPKRILIVDDHITNRQVANLLLSEMKHETVEVDSAQAALALLSMREDFDLVLMDCQMPDMDGYEATRQIRSGAAGEANRSIPIAALTAHALPEDRERCLSAGMNEYLAKPFTMHELAHVIEVLTQGSAPAPSPSTEARLHDQLRVLSDNDSAAYAAILSTYAETLRADFARIGRALESRDSTAIQALAHRLKSSSLQLGASAVGAAMGDVEQQAAGNDLDSIQAGWDALTAKVEQALQWAEREHGTTSTEVAEATPAMPEVAKPPVADEDDADRSCTVLVIDDDPLISRIISRILKAYDVTIQNNSTDAITHCIAHRPALVLCDMMLPDMNGMQIYTHVQEQAPELAERFIFMTGGVFEAEIKTFLDRIDNQVLMKPFDTKTLRALVEKKLGGPKDAQQ